MKKMMECNNSKSGFRKAIDNVPSRRDYTPIFLLASGNLGISSALVPNRIKESVQSVLRDYPLILDPTLGS